MGKESLGTTNMLFPIQFGLPSMSKLKVLDETKTQGFQSQSTIIACSTLDLGKIIQRKNIPLILPAYVMTSETNHPTWLPTPPIFYWFFVGEFHGRKRGQLLDFRPDLWGAPALPSSWIPNNHRVVPQGSQHPTKIWVNHVSVWWWWWWWWWWNGVVYHCYFKKNVCHHLSTLKKTVLINI